MPENWIINIVDVNSVDSKDFGRSVCKRPITRSPAPGDDIGSAVAAKLRLAVGQSIFFRGPTARPSHNLLFVQVNRTQL